MSGASLLTTTAGTAVTIPPPNAPWINVSDGTPSPLFFELVLALFRRSGGTTAPQSGALAGLQVLEHNLSATTALAQDAGGLAALALLHSPPPVATVVSATAAAGDDSAVALALLGGTASGFVPYTSLPIELSTVPVAFVIPGQPYGGIAYHVALALALTVPVGFAASVGFNRTPPAATTVWTVNRLPAGTTTVVALGTITWAAGAIDATFSTYSTSAVICAAGDVLQLVPPATLDVAQADLGISLSLLRQ